MELKNLIDGFTEILGVSDVEKIPSRLLEVVEKRELEVYDEYVKLVNGDLETDNLQKIFQYYFADRKDKMQDYTPKSLARFTASLVSDGSSVVDLCAGSGALTIQCWAKNKELDFELHEFDDRVIPFLLFNLAVRNISATVYHSDALTGQIFAIYCLAKGDKFSKFSKGEVEW